MRIYRRVLLLFRPYLGSIVVAVALLLGTVALNLLKPWPVKWVIDSVLPAGTTLQGLDFSQALLVACLGLVGVYLVHGVLHAANSYLLIKIGLRAVLLLRTQLYTVLQYLPFQFHDQKRSGDSTFRVAYDSQSIQTFFNQGFATVLSSVLTLVGTFVVMFAMSPVLALCSLAVLPLLWVAIATFARRIRRESMRVQEEESDVLAKASEGLTSIRIVHAFGREDHEIDLFTKEANESKQAHLRLNTTHSLSSVVIGLITAMGTALILFIGAQQVVAGQLSVGDLWIFLTYVAMLYQPLEQLSYTAWAMEGAAAGMQRVFEILDTPDSVPDSPHAPAMPRPRGNLEIDRVHFAYSPDHPILRGVSLTVRAGQTVALVGGTGSGKTTLLSLIPRFYDPTQGTLRIDGTDLRTVSKRSLRSHLSLVLQDTVLLTGSVLENIAYGRPDASAAQVRAAAIAAQAHDFIEALPQGYQTQVGERGVRLSGGQKQRIGIARAFLKGAPFLLLDEPTSALDLETEAELMQVLRNLMDRHTTIMVTHRLSTIHDVDQIYVLANGTVAEQGSGSQLLAAGGIYARLWEAGNSPSPR